MRAIHFGDGFRQHLVGVRWPQGVEEVVLGCGFDKPLGLCAWPAGLKELTVPFERLLVGAARSDGGSANSNGAGSGTGGGGSNASGAAGLARPNTNIPEACKVTVLFGDDEMFGSYSFSGDDSDLESLELAHGFGYYGISGGGTDDGVFDDEDDLSFDDNEDERQERDRRGRSSDGVDVFGCENDPWDMGDPWDPRNHGDH